jgi:hypothetical protein
MSKNICKSGPRIVTSKGTYCTNYDLVCYCALLRYFFILVFYLGKNLA